MILGFADDGGEDVGGGDDAFEAAVFVHDQGQADGVAFEALQGVEGGDGVGDDLGVTEGVGQREAFAG